MRSKFFHNEFLFQVFSLIIATIAIHSVYVTSIRPRAAEVLSEQALRLQTEEGYSPPQNFYVIMKDWEQESCVILAIWAFAILGFKTRVAFRERGLLQQDLLHVREGVRILPEDTREYSRALQALPDNVRDLLLPRVLRAALERFGATRNIQDVSAVNVTLCDAEAAKLESELAMIRYVAWAIPSIGFIGTVRGIGGALSQAHRAVEGDISGVTENLGVAFNSTLVALLISIVLMFIIHQLQLMQERLGQETQTYVDSNLIRHLKARD
jgi:biopolymer transport protein ExbB/TolQ